MTIPDSVRSRLAALAALLALVLMAAGPPPADATTGDPEPAAAPAPDAARLRKLQEKLADLDLYRGPIDGRQSPALAAALLSFLQSAGLPPDTAADDALFDRLEAAIRLQRLTRFLTTLGREQSEQARAALLSQPATRDLVAPPGGPAAPGGAPPTAGAVFACLRTLTATCLIDAAIEASQAIEETRLRDWALSEIVKAQARADADDAARATIRRISDARQIIVSLRDVASIQAERRAIDAALTTARSIPDALARIEAELAVAAVQVEAGAAEGAQASLALADQALPQVSEPLQRVALRARIASLRWHAGDRAGGDAALAAARDEIRTLTSRDGRATGVGFVATALAETGRPAEAVHLITENRIANDAPAALAAAAGASAQAHDPSEAERIAALIAEPRFRAVALVQLAAIARRQNDPARAGDLLTEANQATAAIDEAGWRDYPLSRIAQGYLDLKQPIPGAAAARAIGDASMRARLLFLVAHLQAAQGAPDTLGTASEAERTAATITAPLDECWTLTEVARGFADVDDRTAARAMLQRAAEVAAAIQEPASRARAFSRVASVMLGL